MKAKVEHHKHERFLSANQELRGFLQLVERVADGACMISDSDLQIMSQRLFIGSPSIGDASRGETLDADLRNGIAEYVTNFLALQTTLEKLRRIMLTGGSKRKP